MTPQLTARTFSKKKRNYKEGRNYIHTFLLVDSPGIVN